MKRPPVSPAAREGFAKLAAAAHAAPQNEQASDHADASPSAPTTDSKLQASATH
jgi:hypothetical protein